MPKVNNVYINKGRVRQLQNKAEEAESLLRQLKVKVEEINALLVEGGAGIIKLEA